MAETDLVQRECWQCGGGGVMAGCFEDTCCCADGDPEDPDYCCNPHRCDVCRGHGSFMVDPSTLDPNDL